MTNKVLLSAGIFILFFTPCAFASTVLTFHGQIDFTKEQFDLTLNFPSLPAENVSSTAAPDGTKNQPASIALSGVKVSEKDYRISMDLDHVKTPIFDVLSKIESSIEVIPSPSVALLRGEIHSQDSLVDYKPIRELTGQFELRDNQLLLSSLSFGSLSCRGSLGLVYPFNMDLRVFLHDVAMEDFLNFWMGNKQYESLGTVSGEIEVSGNMGRVGIKGNLESYDGYVDQLQYNSFHLNAQGVYPKIEINPSKISRIGGLSFSFSGPFDLSDHENFKKQVSALVFSPLVSESASHREWTIKRLNESRSGSATEIKYLLKKDDKIDEASMILGVAQTMSF